MTQRLFNTLTNRKEELVPLEGKKLGMYVCGPTVYDLSHVGHARVYTAFDTIARWLRATGFELTVVRNYTDVDDKIIRRAKELGQEASQVSERNIKAFQEDMGALGIGAADVEPKVTEHIPEIVQMIERLIEKGFAYQVGGDVYFAVRSFEGYGKLSKRNLDDLLSGARVEVGEQKRDPLDFALWKAAKPGEPSWESPWGKGRPGWHIECSAMSAKYLGPSFDIHGGGKDLIFPHHENEIAQSEAAHGLTFSRYWMHNGFVTIDEEKMAKSLGNFFTVRDLLERFDGEAIRYMLLGTHYRSPIDFSLDSVAAAQGRVAYVYTTLAKARDRLAAAKEHEKEGPILEGERIAEIRGAFETAMKDDFNTAAALGAISDLYAWMNELVEKPPVKDRAMVTRTLAALMELASWVSSILGVFEKDPHGWLLEHRSRLAKEREIDPAWVDERVAARVEARRAKDFETADRIRAELMERGVEIMDSPSGTTWRMIE